MFRPACVPAIFLALSFLPSARGFAQESGAPRSAGDADAKAKMEADIAATETAIETKKQELAAASTEYSKQRVEGEERVQAAISKAQSELQPKIEEAEKQISGAHERLDAAGPEGPKPADIDALRAAQESRQKASDDLAARIDNAQSQYQKERDELESKWAAKSRELEGDLEGLAARLDGYQRKLYEREQRSQQATRQSRSRLNEGYRLAQALARSDDDLRRLEGSLMLLHAATVEASSKVNEVDVLEGLARAKWLQRQGESVEQMLARLEKEGRTAESLAAVRAIEQEVSTSLGADSPLNWRTDSTFWLRLVETLLTAKAEADPAAVWRKRIDGDPTHATLCRQAYLAAARVGPAGAFDYELARPLLASRPVNHEHLADVLITFTRSKTVKDQADFAEIRRQLIADVKSGALGDWEAGENEVYPALARMALAWQEEPPLRSEVQKLLLTILNSRPADTFARFADAMDLSPAVQRTWFLAKTVRLNVKDEDFREAFHQLSSQLRQTSLWLDPRIGDTPTITLSVSGTGPQVLRALTAKAGLVDAELPAGVHWIGRAEAKAQAEKVLADAIAQRDLALKMFPSEPRLAESLNRVLSVEFADAPASDAAAYLTDATGFYDEPGLRVMLVESAIADATLPVTMDGSVPAFLAIRLIGDALECEYIIGPERTVLMVDSSETPNLRRKILQFRERAKRLAGLPGAAAKALNRRVGFEFIESPVSDVVAYGQDAWNAPVRLAPGTQESLPMTLSASKMSLGWALELMTFQAGLDWETDGKEIVIGEPAVIEAYRKRLLEPKATDRKRSGS